MSDGDFDSGTEAQTFSIANSLKSQGIQIVVVGQNVINQANLDQIKTDTLYVSDCSIVLSNETKF
jgi:hypothetical protein